MRVSHGDKKICCSLFKVEMNLNLTSKEWLTLLISHVLLFELPSSRDDKSMLLYKLAELVYRVSLNRFFQCSGQVVNILCQNFYVCQFSSTHSPSSKQDNVHCSVLCHPKSAGLTHSHL